MVDDAREPHAETAREASDRPPRHALLAGGGSGGHVFPALAVAEVLLDRGWRVSYAGSSRGMEARLTAARGLPFVDLPARPLVGRGPLSRLSALTTLLRSTAAARRWVRGNAVDAVVGTGGYVSAPAVLGARLAGVPSLLVEPNVVPGLANRWLSRWAAGAAVAYPATSDHLHGPAWVTGVPVRRDFFDLPPLEPPRPGEPAVVMVVGGSQGARQLNRLLPATLEALVGEGGSEPPLERPLEVLHQAGRHQLDDAREAYRRAGWSPESDDDEAPWRRGELGVEVRLRLVPFIDDMAGALERAHLVVSRAGALATAELCAAGRPSVLVPLTLAGGHQMANARHLADAGAARVVPAEGLDGEPLNATTLADALGSLLGDDSALVAAARAARSLARPGAAEAIADRLEELA